MKLLYSRLNGVAAIALMTSALVAAPNTHRSAAPENHDPQPILWRDPGNVAAKDLFWGPGSDTRAPQPPFAFTKEDTAGTKPKVHVVDARGVAWSVKFDNDLQRGREVPAEIAASRIMWALGYFVEESYLVSDGRIEQLGPLERAHLVLGPDGRFADARFERRPTDIERLSKRWGVDDNPFVGSKELSGLLIVVALLNNWDFRPENTGVLRVSAGGVREDRYVVTDVGTAFGRMDDSFFRRHSRWNEKEYQADRAFIRRADRTTLELHYRPNGVDRARVPLRHARWLAQFTDQLTELQLRQAFAAGGASRAEADAFTTRLLEKIRELRTALS
jgi:hypothetical protein